MNSMALAQMMKDLQVGTGRKTNTDDDKILLYMTGMKGVWLEMKTRTHTSRMFKATKNSAGKQLGYSDWRLPLYCAAGYFATAYHVSTDGH
jgi:hypothetical protein